MPTTSSLLKSAQSLRKKIKQQEDDVIDFNWSLSAKTYDDFLEYSRIINDRREFYSDDPSELLSLEKKLVSARKAYTSNEIQRQNINIVEGSGTSQTKYDKMVELFYQAIDNGDYDLAQNLNLQLDNLSVKIQQEAVSAENARLGTIANASKSADKLIKDFKNKAGYVETPDGREYPSLALIANEAKNTGKFTLADGTEASPFEVAEQTMRAMTELIVAQYENAPDQETIDKLEADYGPQLQDIYKNLTFSIGGQKLNVEDVVTAKQNELINNPVYSFGFDYNPSTGTKEFKLIENNVDKFDVVRQFNPETGAEEYIATGVRSTDTPKTLGGTDRGLDARITNEGFFIGDTQNNKGNIDRGTQQVQTSENDSIRKRLESVGYKVEEKSGKIYLTGQNITTRQATIQQDGTVRYFDDNGQLIELSTFNKPLEFYDERGGISTRNFGIGETRVVDPSEVSPFQTASRFGGVLSQRSTEGQGYLNNFTTPNNPSGSAVDLARGGSIGLGRVQTPNIRLSNNSTFASEANFRPLTTNLLQGAATTRNQIAEQEEKKRLIQLQVQRNIANQVQQAQVFNLNQTPVARVPNRQPIAVTRAQPNPQIKITPQPNNTKINNVGVARPQSNISVGVARPRYLTIPGLSF